MEAFQFKPYLIFLPNRLRIIFTQFRVSNTTLFRTMKQVGGSTFIKNIVLFVIEMRLVTNLIYYLNITLSNTNELPKMYFFLLR